MASIRQLFNDHVAQVVDSPSGLELASAKGVHLYGADGKQYLDLISGISVSNVGHSHPAVVSAVQEQAAKHMHLMVYGEFAIAPQAQLAEKLLSKLPNSFGAVYFTNSGSESTEGALKLAKRYTGRTELISFENAYHGSTHGALSLQGDYRYKQGFHPLLPDTQQLPFNNLEALQQITTRTAAVMVECVQAAAGYIPPAPGFLEALRKRTQEVGALLIFDEVQTGLGRTGHWFATTKYGVTPDIITLAKGFGGGMPLGAFAAPKHIMDCFKHHPHLGHITTFGGHPVSCAASLAAIKVLENNPQWLEDIPAKSKLIEDTLVHPNIERVSGVGLMYSVKLKPQVDVYKVVAYMEEHGVISGTFLFVENSIRITPPLPITLDELHGGLCVILEGIDAAS